MTLQQEAYEKIMKLPEDSIRLFIVMADEIARQKGLSSESASDEDLKRKQKAFQEMEKMREKSPFPKNFNYEKAREEAMYEKYGPFRLYV